MKTTVIEIDTGRAASVTDLTPRVADFVKDMGDGLVSVFLPHATAGLAIIEIGAGSDTDLLETVERLLPRDNRYRHRHGSLGHGADHLLPALLSPSLVVPVIDGGLALGTWQSIVIYDPNHDNPHRRVRLSFLPG